MAFRGLHAGHSLPLEIVDRRLAVGIFLTLFGIAFTAFPVAFIILKASGAEVRSSGSVDPSIFYAVFIAVGVTIAVAGIHNFMYRMHVIVDQRSVRGRRSGLWGRRAWTAPLDQYTGVLGETKIVGSNKRRRVQQLVHLKHFRDEALDVLLMRADASSDLRAETEHYAKLLGVPVLSSTADGGYDKRDAADLDKSVAELAREGRLEVPDAPVTMLEEKRVRQLPYPNGFAFEQNFGGALTALGLIFLVIGIPIALTILVDDLAGTLRASGWTVRGNAHLLPFAGIIVALTGAAVVVAARFLIMRLEVDSRGVRTEVLLGSHTLKRTELYADEVEEVRAVAQSGVFINADKGSTWFGPGLSVSANQHIRDAVLATLARASAPSTVPTTAPLPAPEPPESAKRIEALRGFAAQSLDGGRSPQEVFAKLADMGAPAIDIATCMRAIAADPTSAHASSVRGFLEARAPGSATTASEATMSGGVAGRATAASRVKRHPPTTGGRSMMSTFSLVLRYGIPLVVVAWITRDFWLPSSFRDDRRSSQSAQTRPAQLNNDQKAAAKAIQADYADFAIKPSINTGYVMVGGKGLRAESHGNDLRIALDTIRLAVHPLKGDARYESIGINVSPSDPARYKQGKSVWDREVRGGVSKDNPVKTIDGHVFVLPGFAGICSEGCRARLLLSVRASPNLKYAENTEFAEFRSQAGQSIVEKPAGPSKHWDTYYDRALAAKSRKDFVKTEQHFMETLKFITDNLGWKHPAAARTLVTAASMYKQQNRDADYERSMLQALDILDDYPDGEVKQMLGDVRFHVDQELVSRRLADFLWDKRDYARAFKFYRRAYEAAPGLQTTDYSRNLKLAFSSAGMMATACVLGDFDTADKAMAELKRRIKDVKAGSRKMLQYWIDTGEPRLTARKC